MDANEQKARELLAAEYELDGQTLVASHIRNGSYEYIRAIRAIMAALAQQVPADGEWVPSGADYDRSIHSNPDAKAWADFFVATFPGQADKHDLMLGWFANAMMAMHDHLKQSATPQAPQPVVDGTIGQQAVDVAAHEALTLLEQATCHDGRYGQMERIGWQESAQKLLPRLRAALAAHGKPNS